MVSGKVLQLLALACLASVSSAEDAPQKPMNLSCQAVQKGHLISSNLACWWNVTGRQTKDVPTTYTVFVTESPADNTFNATTTQNSVDVAMNIFPHYLRLDIRVEARNEFGTTESEHLVNSANCFVKTNPPSNVMVIPEKTFPTSVLINWTVPLRHEYVALHYHIRYCPRGLQTWIDVPLSDTAYYIQSFRLQSLQPDTVYDIQVRCKYSDKCNVYWSNWSTNATVRTPEDRPGGKPDIWKIIDDGTNERQVEIICKDPKYPNGRITSFNMRIYNNKEAKNGSGKWESIPVNRTEAETLSSQGSFTLKKISLPDKKWSFKVSVVAVNSVGQSSEGVLGIDAQPRGPAPEEVKVWSHEGRLWVKWKPLNATQLSEYVVEWLSDGDLDWQRENRGTTFTAIKGNLRPYVCYNISVYPIYHRWIGKPTRVQAFLEEGAPLQGPAVRLKGPPGSNEAVLALEEIPRTSRRGFITNYTIFYSNGTTVHSITVPFNTTSYTLKSLSRNTKYEVVIRASTIGGSTNGSSHTFTTMTYAQGEIEGIVVGVSIGFLFLFLMAMLICIYTKDVIKNNFWPQIPNPGDSTIGTWAPDHPLKTEIPKESCLSGISVLDVDMCDSKCMFEEDKASLALKKDKYLSEEHSSGIGGSSCMSSPRQSVSDSDEGGDMADTTSSTVQYSSVVASSGYKGQTPSSQPQQSIFSRSESTQPLLDSEEHPDILMQEGSRHFQHFHRQPCFARRAGNGDPADSDDFNLMEMEQQETLESLDFGPLEEDSEQATPSDSLSGDWQQAPPPSSYMPQLGGYRPQ
ncbi:interleukin-6 receptor subunit beta isoform X2 [Mugil cephalus]|uniref:interleukin-6 receptor subunit beta isoform X2 n=1 Tax=Mugil cephalus TaxID=48193 RepID=UPI001FB62673|nr:interleukin-6 receptor subunit beta isoform X2 [Mugil cephalus]